MSFEEFLPIYSQCKKDKEVGAFEDLLEGMKVYDKAENGTMMEGELAHVLLSLGEKLTDAEAEDILKLCSGGADDEGFIKYESEFFLYIVYCVSLNLRIYRAYDLIAFIKNVMVGPFPEEAK